MASLSTKIKLYCEANSKTVNFDPDTGNVYLRNDGAGDYIKTWNVDGLDKPTDEQIASYETAGNTEETNNTVRNTRRVSYGNIGDQLDLLYKDMVAGKLDTTGDWATKIKAVKDANPKS
tara:strand:- start:2376 stop:2732 length:357 start_codon:yes stop_codon:yes gene_type:complete